MKTAKDNPESNHLGAGITAEQLEMSVRSSGYPLQRVVAEELLSDFTVTEEWGYLDRDSKEHRTLDIFAYRQVRESARLWLGVAMLVECKRSDLPYVFFEAAAPHVPLEFPLVAGLRGRTPELHVAGVGSRPVSVAEFLRLRDFGFVADGPSICSSFARAERKGKELDLSGGVPFNQVILPLVSALQHFVNLQKIVGSPERAPACLAVPLCILDAPMISVRGGPESPELMLSPWVRIVRQEAVEEQHSGFWRHYVVDFMHRGYLATFVQQHLLPFVEQFAERALSREDLLLAAKAQVPHFEAWEFRDLQHVK